MSLLYLALCASILGRLVYGALPFESIRLEARDIEAFPAVSFPKENAQLPKTECRAFPGSEDWPTDDDWRRFNASVDGALLKPLPPAAVCYNGPYYDAGKCNYLLNNATANHFYLDDPLTVLTHWPQGSTCMPALNPTGTCTQGGFPAYVVNATTVKHIQAAINFARNKNLRLVIKNTGHDLGGRSVGAGALSIWTHNLKSFEYLPQYTQGNYSGMAAHFGSGLETWEMFNYMSLNGITIVVPGGRSVGANGGWFAGGGHGNLASYYGLAADQALEIHVVTADGQFLIANPKENEDLFYALRGGGGSTYGVVTSVIVKAYPPISWARSTLNIACNPPPDTNARATNAQIVPSTNFLNNTEAFWKAISIYFRFKKTVVDAGGVDWDYIYPLGNGSFSFRVNTTFPGRTVDEAVRLLQPLYDGFAREGLAVLLARSDMRSQPYAASGTAPAAALANKRYHSRLFPRANWESDALFERTMAAVRNAVEGGAYIYHGLSIGPTADVAGWPGRTAAVLPAWRNAVLHAILITEQKSGISPREARDEESRIQGYMQPWRDSSPGSGSYMNEGDPGEPNWQQAFYGENYEKLLEVKRKRDSWGVFWAATTVGSEGWEVRAENGLPGSQNGRLCRVG